ncbi:hypothetical protein fugu_001597 [Takifugu bimaculatus]|uniref:Uncharacterized protein n=1 Tax=Takifugu bimaculatus TaxID=433685 RepID=A0A4Z2BM87_9TELE|nr:hypothetical protein fugu_001597 [Takifugu bimaculatus]
MQSLASLMSYKQSDVGNLEDFYDSEEEAGEERKNSHGSGHGPHVAARPPSQLTASRVPDLAWRPVSGSGFTVTSEMVGITSTGISSTISAPSSAAPLEPPDPSVPLPSHPQPARATQQSQPPPSASTLPPYIRAHPPVLPKIFQPGAGSGCQRPHSFHSDSAPPTGVEAFSPFTSPSSSSCTVFQTPASCQTSVCSWRAQSVPSLPSTSSFPAPHSSFSVPQTPPAPRQPTVQLGSVGESTSVLTKPSSLPSAPESAPWQSEWRSVRCQAPLSQPDLSPHLLHVKKLRTELPSSCFVSAEVSVEQEPQGGSGFVASWNPQVPPTVDTPLPPAFSPLSAPCRPPIPLSQPPSQSPDNQEAGYKRQLSTLCEEENQATTSTASDTRTLASVGQELLSTGEHRRDLGSAGRDSFTSPLLHTSTTPPARGLEYTSGTQRESVALPHIQPTHTDIIAPQAKILNVQEDTSASVSEIVLKPRTHLSKMSIQVGNVGSLPSSKSVHSVQPQLFKSTQMETAECLSHEAATLDLGNENFG